MPRHKVKLNTETPILCANCKKFSPQLTDYKQPCPQRKKIPTIFCAIQQKINNKENNETTKSLPNYKVVRQAIESVKVEKYRVFLMTIYLCGAARACELTAKRPNSEKIYPLYGISGNDCWLDETDPPDPKWIDVLEMLLSIQEHTLTIKQAISKAKEKIPVVVFKVKIAKTYISKNEEAPFRLVALPLPPKYEPWTEQILAYFKKRKGKKVFPFSRVEVSDYLDRKDPVFRGLTYRVKKYTHSTAKDENLKTIDITLYRRLIEAPLNKQGIKTLVIDNYEYHIDFRGKIYRREVYKVSSHPKPLKIHGLRHIRTDELLKDYNFDGVDLVAYVGWSGKGVALPTQACNYAELRENWQRYIKKLCIKSKDYDKYYKHQKETLYKDLLQWVNVNKIRQGDIYVIEVCKINKYIKSLTKPNIQVTTLKHNISANP